MSELEYRYATVSLEGKTLRGTVMKYGEVSSGAPRPEKFLPGAFSYDDVILNFQHDRTRPIARTGGGGLELTDSRELLEMRVEVPETREGMDALELVKRSILRGLSVEFRAVSERYEAGVRVIEKALLSGIGLVDKPAYSGSKVEARAIAGVSISFSIPFGAGLQCECCPDADVVSFDEGAFTESLNQGKVIAVAGNYRNALSSQKRDTLKTRETKEALEVETELADVTAGRDILAQAADVEIIGRPILDFAKSDYEVVDGIAKVHRAHLRAFLLGSTDADNGWQPVKVKREENRQTCDSRGRFLWL